MKRQTQAGRGSGGRGASQIRAEEGKLLGRHIYLGYFTLSQSKAPPKKPVFLTTSDMTPVRFRGGLGQVQLSVARSTKNVMGNRSTHSQFDAESLTFGSYQLR